MLTSAHKVGLLLMVWLEDQRRTHHHQLQHLYPMDVNSQRVMFSSCLQALAKREVMAAMGISDFWIWSYKIRCIS